jgi:hypothetical protein
MINFSDVLSGILNFWVPLESYRNPQNLCIWAGGLSLVQWQISSTSTVKSKIFFKADVYFAQVGPCKIMSSTCFHINQTGSPSYPMSTRPIPSYNHPCLTSSPLDYERSWRWTRSLLEASCQWNSQGREQCVFGGLQRHHSLALMRPTLLPMKGAGEPAPSSSVTSLLIINLRKMAEKRFWRRQQNEMRRMLTFVLVLNTLADICRGMRLR